MTQARLVARLSQMIAPPSPAVLPGKYRALGIFSAVLGLGLLAAALYLAPEKATVGLVLLGLGLPTVLLLWHRPEFGLLALLFLTSSFLPADLVDVRLPIGGGFDLRDLTLIGLFGLIFFRELSRGSVKVPWWPVGGPLLLFLVLAVFSAFYALVIEHVESNWALNDLRILSMYATFFITLWSIKRPGQLKILMVGLFVIADLTTAVVYLQQILGANHPVLQAMTMVRDWRVYEEAGAVRVIPAGHILMHFMWFVALGLLLLPHGNRRLRAFCVVQVLFIGGGHLLAYTRAQWIGMILGLGLIFVILVPRYKQYVAKAAIIAGGVLLLMAGLVASGVLSEEVNTPFVAGVSERFVSLLTPAETADTGSLQWRSFEIEKALQAIKKQPLTGVGLGNRYRSLTAYMEEAAGWWTRGSIAAGEVSRFTRYVHNSYVSVAVKMGVPGIAILLWFCAAVLVGGFRAYRRIPNSEYEGVVLGLLVGFAGVLLWCYFHAHLIKAESTPVIGLMAALIGCQVYTPKGGSALRSGQVGPLPAVEDAYSTGRKL